MPSGAVLVLVPKIALTLIPTVNDAMRLRIANTIMVPKSLAVVRWKMRAQCRLVKAMRTASMIAVKRNRGTSDWTVEAQHDDAGHARDDDRHPLPCGDPDQAVSASLTSHSRRASSASSIAEFASDGMLSAVRGRTRSSTTATSLSFR